jgi:hypothetical protein
VLRVQLENAEAGTAWIESMTALVGRKPLEEWNDGDVARFNLQIGDLDRRFRAIE